MPDRTLLVGRPAVLTVDFQNDFCHPDGAMARLGHDISGAVAAAERMAAFLSAVREHGLPVIHARTVHGEWTDSALWLNRERGSTSICRAGTWGAEFYGIAPTAGEHVVTKHRYSALIGTDLDVVLRSRGISTLLVGGVITQVCVESTVRDAFMLGYWTVTLSDCCGYYTLSDHEAALTVLGQFFGTVANSVLALDTVLRADENQ